MKMADLRHRHGTLSNDVVGVLVSPGLLQASGFPVLRSVVVLVQLKSLFTVLQGLVMEALQHNRTPPQPPQKMQNDIWMLQKF